MSQGVFFFIIFFATGFPADCPLRAGRFCLWCDQGIRSKVLAQGAKFVSFLRAGVKCVLLSYDVLMGITELNGLTSQGVKGSLDRQSRIGVNYGLGFMNEERENRLVQTRKAE